MKANAFVLEGSHPVRGWESRRKVSGVLAGVRFYKKGRTFVASDLSPDEVERLLANRFVRVEIIVPHRIPSVFDKPRQEDPKPDPVPEPKVDPLLAAFGAPVKRRGRKPKTTF